MKLIQLNIWGGKLEYQIPDFLNQEKPDIVCMQEVQDLRGPSGAIFVTLDELQTKCNFAYRYMSPTYTSMYQRRQNHYGNAILSNLPLEDTEAFFTYGEYNDNFDMTEDDFNVRNVLHVQAKVNNKLVHILNHHGFLVPGSKQGNDETVRQMQMISQKLQQLTGPIILAGDFNLAASSKSIELINKQLRNLAAEQPDLTTTYTQFSNQTDVCDYIFVNDEVTVKDFRTSEALVSDHKPLILEFEV